MSPAELEVNVVALANVLMAERSMFGWGNPILADTRVQRMVEGGCHKIAEAARAQCVEFARG